MKPIPEGFQLAAPTLNFRETFESSVGPLYCRKVDVGYEFGLWIEPRHSNIRGTTHGGFMTAVSDMACGLTTYFHYGESGTAIVTVSMSYQFMGAIAIGSWLSVICKIRKAGRSTVFVDCEHYVEGELVGTSQAVLKATKSRDGEAAPKPDC
jgi:acyl-coenzyme A thioesterase 13